MSANRGRGWRGRGNTNRTSNNNNGQGRQSHSRNWRDIGNNDNEPSQAAREGGHRAQSYNRGRAGGTSQSTTRGGTRRGHRAPYDPESVVIGYRM